MNKIQINYWLNTRKGFYDPKRIFHLKGKAFERYIETAEKRYQEHQQRKIDRETKEAIRAIVGLDNDFKEWFEEKLFPTLLEIHNQDLDKVAEILKQDQYQKLIDHYEVRSKLYDQYRAEQRRQRSKEGHHGAG